MNQNFTEERRSIIFYYEEIHRPGCVHRFFRRCGTAAAAETGCGLCRRGTKIYAVTFDTVLHPSCDLDIAKKVAKEMGAIHQVIFINELDNSAIQHNPVDRCYQCKKMLFQNLITFDREGPCGVSPGGNQ